VIFARRSAGEPDIDVRIRETLRDIRPLLHIEDADVSLVEFDTSTGTATLRIEGDCPDCDMSAANMIEGIGAHLRARVPEVKDVRRIANPTNE
jgi:Fe-S cluster biogenesis protein NfuA